VRRIIYKIRVMKRTGLSLSERVIEEFMETDKNQDDMRTAIMETVDVILLTKNSDRVLRECLASVYENVPIERLIVVDAFSTDNTLKILGEFNAKYGNVKIIAKAGTRGVARERGIREVRTGWFVFVDSDIVLCRDWFRKARRLVNSRVGAVWGVDVPGDVENSLLVSVLKRMEARVFDIRGGCHDILVRYDSVKDIKIPSQLHTLEDAYIREWITGRGYDVIVSYEAWCRHYKTASGLFSRENASSTILELKNTRLMRERLIYAAIFAFIWFLQGAKSGGKKGIDRGQNNGANYAR
jgi:glycosyltransferase involved in cell wall biosynthesis